METNDYLIRNMGCDDDTYLIAKFTDTEANFLRDLFNRINQNSSYGCQPTIYIKKIKITTKITLKDDEEWWCDGYADTYGDYDMRLGNTYYKYEKLE